MILIRSVILSLVLCTAALAQFPRQVRFVSTDPTGTCAPLYITQNIVTGVMTGCVGGSWATIGGGVSGSGTVTSAAGSFTGGLISIAGSPITTAGTLAFTVAGTSGGIPYFSSASTWASSGVLGANLPLFGGGAGASPIAGTRSGNTTKVVTTTGTLTSGDCAKFDGSGNLIDNGSACGGIVSAGTANQVAKYATTGTTISGSTVLSDDATYAYLDGPLDLKTNSLVIEIPNSSSPGTTVNLLARIPAAEASVLTTSAGDVITAVGVVVDGAGTTGSAKIGILGQFSCLFDNTATTAGDFITPSSTTAGTCHDFGTTRPTTGEVMGQVLSTHAACGSAPCGPYTVLFGTPDIFLPGTVASGSVTSVGFAGGLVSVATPTTTPAFTVAGTSGGIPYFSSASTWASSAVMTADRPIFGGGAGVAPFVGTRSGNTTTVATTTGAQTSGNCVSIDANGNHVASGSACNGVATAVPPYSTTTITSSPMSILASTHLQGTKAFGKCWDAATNPQQEENCRWDRNPSNGDLTLTYSTAPLQIDIFGSTGASSFANPMTTAGDIIYGGVSGVATRLAGTAGILRNNATTPSYAELSGDATTSGSNVVTVAKINGIAVTGTPSTGQVPTATSSSAATWQNPSGGISGLTPGTIPVALTSSTLDNSAISQVSTGSVKILDATGSGITGLSLEVGASQLNNFLQRWIFGGVNDFITFLPSVGGSLAGQFLGQTNAGGIKWKLSTRDPNQSSVPGMVFSSDGIFYWNSTADLSGGSRDLGISRDSAGVLAVGTGAQGSFAGTVKATDLDMAGSGITFSGLGSASGTPDSVCLNTNTLKRNAALTCTVSNESVKHGFGVIPASMSDLANLKPIQFRYDDQPERVRWGFGAKQVASVAPALADGWRDDGQPWSLDQNAILALTVKALQEVNARVEKLEKGVK